MDIKEAYAKAEEKAKIQLKQILLVEDKDEQIAYAKRDLADTGSNIMFVKTLADALKAIKELPFGGVLTDMFFPTGFADEEDTRIRKEFAKILNWSSAAENSDKLPPSGIYVIKAAVEKELPLSIVTDGAQHGYRSWTSWHDEFGGQAAREGSHPCGLAIFGAKNWSAAYRYLRSVVVSNETKEARQQL